MTTHSDILLIASSFEEVSLITASAGRQEGAKTTDNSHYPLGIAYLHSYLESRGHRVGSLFVNNYAFSACLELVAEAIEQQRPTIIGLQILTPNRVSSYRLIEYLHDNHPNTQLVIGGMHATIMHRQLLEKYPYLIAVPGEGEITFSELADALAAGDTDLMEIDGLVMNQNGTVVTTKPRALIADLDTLPFPKHELFFTGERTSGCILTARGCPFNCSFCSLDSLSKRKVRYRSITNVVDEIEVMIRKFPSLKNIWIHDDTFFVNNKRVVEFCDEIIRRRIKMDFVCSGRVKPLRPEMVAKLEQANFKKVLFGLESGDEGILKACRKKITQADVRHAFELFAQSSIEIYAFLIVGLPGETRETIAETARFVQELQRINYIRYHDDIAVLTIYPGTEVYQIAKAGGVIDDDFWLTDAPSPLFTLENSQEQLLAFKETLLNHVCFERLRTVAGLRAQWRMLPYVLKHLYSRNRAGDVLARWAERILPGAVHHLLRKVYRFVRYGLPSRQGRPVPAAAKPEDQRSENSAATPSRRAA